MATLATCGGMCAEQSRGRRFPRTPEKFEISSGFWGALIWVCKKDCELDERVERTVTIVMAEIHTYPFFYFNYEISTGSSAGPEQGSPKSPM